MTTAQNFTQDMSFQINRLVNNWVKLNIPAFSNLSKSKGVILNKINRALEGKCENDNTKNMLVSATFKVWAMNYPDTYNMIYPPVKMDNSGKYTTNSSKWA
jgi:hypothetical protein